MISYEVTCGIPIDLAEEFDAYMLDKHVREVIATGCFTAATYYRDGVRRRTIYEAPDQASLDKYIATEAKRLREDFLNHFPDGVTVTRENWDVVASIE